MSTLGARQTTHSDRRRSQRVLLSVAVRISGMNANGVAFAEDTSTVIVNAQGGMVLLKTTVHLGQQLKITNLNTSEETLCVAIDLNAGTDQAYEVGLEFIEAAPRFWRISFPPTDWTSRSAEAKRMGTPKTDRAAVPLIPSKK